MSRSQEIVCGGSGIIFTVGLLAGWGLLAGHMLPPTEPMHTAEVVAAYHQASTLAIQFGMVITLFSCGFLVLFGSAIATQLQRLLGANSSLVKAQLGCATLSAAFVITAMTFFAIAAYRPERSQELTLLLSDIAWICFTMPVSALMLWMLVTGWAILSDRSRDPLYARWLGFFSLFCSSLTVPGYLVVVFKSGPFAWNGLLAFWVPIATAAAWFILLSLATIRAGSREAVSATG